MRAYLISAAAALALAACQSASDGETASAPSADTSGAQASSRAPAAPSNPPAATPGTIAPDVEAGIETPKAPQQPAPDQSPENPR